MRKYTLASDLIQVKAIQPVVYKQYDNGDSLEVELYQDGEKINLVNETVLAFFELENGTVIEKTCNVTNGNAIATLDNNILSLSGKVKVEFTVYKEDTQTTTRTLLIYVEDSIDRNGAIETVPEYDVVSKILDFGPEFEQKVTEVEAATTDANNAVATLNTEVNNLKMRYLTPVATFTDIATTYTSPAIGEVVQTIDDGKFYRWNGTTWKFITLISNNAITDIQNKLSEQEDHTQILTHGLNAIYSDTPGSLKVEFGGNTLINLLGNIGNFESGSISTLGYLEQGSGTSGIASTGFYGNKSLEIVRTNGTRRVFKYLQSITDGYYLVGSKVKVSGSVFNLRSSSGEDTGGYGEKEIYSVTDTAGAWKNAFGKLEISGGTGFTLIFGDAATKTATWNIDGVFIYKISKEIYDQIGVLPEYSGDKLADKFPYVDSVQSVVNPYIKVSGSNLLPPFTEWDLGSRSEVSSLYELKINDGSGWSFNYSPNFSIVGGQPYYLSLSEYGGNVRLHFYDKDGTKISDTGAKTNDFYTTSPQNAVQARLELYVPSSSDVYYKKPMLNLGSTAKPFTPKNDSYVYAETTLAGIEGGKKDILYYNESLDNPRWEKEKWFESVVLDGSLSWAGGIEYDGYRKVQTSLFNNMNPTEDTSILIKYDGSVVNDMSVDGDGMGGYLVSLRPEDVDTGWVSGMSLSENMIKGYFNGWKYNGDGTTHSWESIVDGSSPSTNTLAFVADPANSPTSYENYFLSYQLASPVTEPISVEGDLSIQGSAQVSVENNVIVREKVTPIKGTGSTADGSPPSPTNKYYFINNNAVTTNGYQVPSGSQFKHKAEKIIGIYKNGVLDTNWTITSNSSANGKVRAFVQEDKFDTTAEYTVTYQATNEGQSANATEVKATYNQSIKSSFARQTEKVSDQGTEISILKRQMLETIIRVDALEGA